MISSGSIRGRLLRTQLLWSLLWGLAMTSAVWLAMQNEVDELFDESLQSVAESLIAPMVDLHLATPAALAQLAPSAQPTPGTHFVWQLVGPGPAAPVLAAARDAPAKALQATPSAGFADVPGWRVFGMALGRDGHMLYVAQTRDERREAKLEMLFTAVVAGVPMVLLALLWLNARVRHDLLPLQALSRRLAAYDPMRPGATLGPAEHEELQAVHAAIDALAGRLTRRVAHERAFTAHAAHALRTPLAGIDAQLAVALRESCCCGTGGRPSPAPTRRRSASP